MTSRDVRTGNNAAARRRYPGSVLAVLALAVLFAACLKSQPVNAAADNNAVPDSRIWEGLVPPAKQHVAWRLPQIDDLKPIRGGVLFVGDSITEGAPLYAMFPGLTLANHGIGWDTSDGVLLRLDQIRRNQPQRIFILIGTNDVNYTESSERIARNILSIVARLSTDMPDTEIYVTSILPREQPGNAVLIGTNAILQDAATDGSYVYLDLASHMKAADGTLRKDLTYDGLHLNVHGYSVWARVLETCVRQGCSGVAPPAE